MIGRYGLGSSTARLDELARLADHQRELQALTRALVGQLSAAGVGWGDIGRALGMTRQGARQRFSRRS